VITTPFLLIPGGGEFSFKLLNAMRNQFGGHELARVRPPNAKDPERVDGARRLPSKPVGIHVSDGRDVLGRGVARPGGQHGEGIGAACAAWPRRRSKAWSRQLAKPLRRDGNRRTFADWSADARDESIRDGIHTDRRFEELLIAAVDYLR